MQKPISTEKEQVAEVGASLPLRQGFEGERWREPREGEWWGEPRQIEVFERRR